MEHLNIQNGMYQLNNLQIKMEMHIQNTVIKIILVHNQLILGKNKIILLKDNKREDITSLFNLCKILMSRKIFYGGR